MKKTILCVSLLAVTSFAMAGSGNLAKGDKTSLSTDGSLGTAATKGTCEMVASGQVANIQLSVDVVGSWNCDSANAGVSTAHPKGKGKYYTASSNGGKIAENASSTGAEYTGDTQANTDTATGAAAAKNAS